MLYNFHSLSLVTLPNCPVKNGNVRSHPVKSTCCQTGFGSRKHAGKMPCVVIILTSDYQSEERIPSGGDSNVKFLQAKQWLLYNFNRSSSFSNILFIVFSDFFCKELSLWHLQPTSLWGESSHKDLKFGWKGFLSVHCWGSDFIIDQEMVFLTGLGNLG